jgi:hypothetical protein
MIVSTARKSPTVYVGTSSATMPDGPAVKVLRDQILDLAPVALNAVRQRIGKLNWWLANWDGYGSAKPSPAAVDSARSIMTELFRAATLTQYGWSDPLVGANETGDVVLEWWQDNRKVTVYVTPTEMRYVLVWGDDMDTEMEENVMNAPRQDFEGMWSWLHT